MSELVPCPKCGSLFDPTPKIGRPPRKYCSPHCASSIGGSVKSDNRGVRLYEKSSSTRVLGEPIWFNRFINEVNVQFAKWQERKGLVSNFNSRRAE